MTGRACRKRANRGARMGRRCPEVPTRLPGAIERGQRSTREDQASQFRPKALAAGSATPKEVCRDHLHHAGQLDRAGRASHQGFTPPARRGQEGASRHGRRIHVRLHDHATDVQVLGQATLVLDPDVVGPVVPIEKALVSEPELLSHILRNSIRIIFLELVRFTPFWLHSILNFPELLPLPGNTSKRFRKFSVYSLH